MDLYILRHAIAVPHGTSGYEQDSERPLTKKGKDKMLRIAEGLRAFDLSFDLILSSPFPRAKQTAQIVADVFGAKKVLEYTDHLTVGGDPENLVDEIQKKYADRQSIMLVGHEPYLSGLISVLVSGSANLSITMKKGGLCKLTGDTLQYGRCATLEWLLVPSQMTRIG